MPLGVLIKSGVLYARICHIIKHVVCLSLCVCTSALAIFMDQFWNQGYVRTPNNLGMTRKIKTFKLQKNIFLKFSSLNQKFPSQNALLSEPRISLPKCIFPPWMPHTSINASSNPKVKQVPLIYIRYQLSVVQIWIHYHRFLIY